MLITPSKPIMTGRTTCRKGCDSGCANSDRVLLVEELLKFYSLYESAVTTPENIRAVLVVS